ncbi:tetratricopeptide repeat protein [Streptomyces phaeochromogenes]
MGGVGKSTVALRLAEILLHAGRTVWWVTVSDASAFTSAAMTLAVTLGSPANEVEAALAGRLDPSDVLWRQLEQRSGWTLILDNADDVAAFAVAGRTARDGNGWIRPSTAGTVLVTSRDSDSNHWGRHVDIHPVSWLTVNDGAQLLLDLAPRAGSHSDARQLAEHLGGLPLALHQTGAHLSSLFVTERTFAEFSSALAQDFDSMLSSGSDERQVVTSTWEVSLRQLARQGLPHARPLLTVLSYFLPGTLVPLRLLDPRTLQRLCPDQDTRAVRQGLEALHSVGLLEVQGTEGVPDAWAQGVAVHPLVAEVARRQARDKTDEADPAAPHLLARDLLGTVSPGTPEDAKNWPKFAQITVHTESLATCPIHEECSEYAKSVGFRAQELAQARYLYSSGQASRSRDLANRLRRDWSASLGEEHSDTLSALNRLGAALTLLDQNDEARDIFSTVLASRTKLLGAHHPETLKVSNNLGVALKELHDFPAACNVLRESTKNLLAILGPDSVQALRSACNLGEVLVLMARYRAGYRILASVHARRTALLGAEHPDTLWTAHYLALALHGMGRSERAHALLVDTHRVHERVLGKDHPDTLAVGVNLAEVVGDLGDRATAISLLRSILNSQSHVLGERHASTLRTVQRLADWSE